LIDHEEYKLPS
jgi:hypothetical protein